MTEEFTFNKVAILGAGVLGSQMAFQAAWHGKTVYLYDPFPTAIAKLPKRWGSLRKGYQADLRDYTPERFDDAMARIIPTSDVTLAVSGADIVLEAVPESLDVKRETWHAVSEILPERAVLATNTSQLLPSEIAVATGHKDHFVAMHYANRIWAHPLTEIMGTADTDPLYVKAAIQFAEETGTYPFFINKEIRGGLFNTLNFPWIYAAASLYMRGVGDPAEIDEAWVIGTGGQLGPFAILDGIGFRLGAYLAKMDSRPEVREFGEKLNEAAYAGVSGVADGQGFYLYDNMGRNLGPNPYWTV